MFVDHGLELSIARAVRAGGAVTVCHTEGCEAGEGGAITVEGAAVAKDTGGEEAALGEAGDRAIGIARAVTGIAARTGGAEGALGVALGEEGRTGAQGSFTGAAVGAGKAGGAAARIGVSDPRSGAARLPLRIHA